MRIYIQKTLKPGKYIGIVTNVTYKNNVETKRGLYNTTTIEVTLNDGYKVSTMFFYSTTGVQYYEPLYKIALNLFGDIIYENGLDLNDIIDMKVLVTIERKILDNQREVFNITDMETYVNRQDDFTELEMLSKSESDQKGDDYDKECNITKPEKDNDTSSNINPINRRPRKKSILPPNLQRNK